MAAFELLILWMKEKTVVMNYLFHHDNIIIKCINTKYSSFIIQLQCFREGMSCSLLKTGRLHA